MKGVLLFVVLITCVIGAYAESDDKDDLTKVYDECLNEQKSMNNAVVIMCAEEASSAAKDEMNDLYDQLYNSLIEDSPDEAAALEKAQKAWLVYRNQHCKLAGSLVGSPMYYVCPMELNISRVLEFRQLLGK